jgi:hypothetical protein
MKVANNFPKKTIVRETGLVNRDTIVPLSYSPEILFMAVTIPKRKKVKLPPLNVAAKKGFCPILKAAGTAKLTVVNTKAITSAAMNFFLRIFQSISYLTIAQKRVNQLGCTRVVIIEFFLLGL